MPLRILKALHQLEGQFKEDPILKRPEGNDKTHVCQLRTVHLPDEIGRKGPSLIADDDRPKESDESEHQQAKGDSEDGSSFSNLPPHAGKGISGTRLSHHPLVQAYTL